jgi:hypothetical protein
MKITEAMSEIKLFVKKISSQRDFILRNLTREEWRKDPFEKDHTTQEAQVKAALQSINDLEKNIVAYRYAITKANMNEHLTLEGIDMSVAEWLIWRREVFPLRKQLLGNLANQIANNLREQQATQRSYSGKESEKNQPANYIVNISEKWLKEEVEKLDTIEQRLDGQLSMINSNRGIEI